MKFEFKPLRELTSKITKGTTPTTFGKPFTESGINFIKAEALNGDSQLEVEGISFIDDETHRLLKRSVIEDGDVLVTIAGANIGKVGYASSDFLPANTNQAVGVIRPKSDILHPRFLYYFFKQKRTLRYIQSLNAQAAQPNINLEMLGNIPIPVPCFQKQVEFANIVSNYDELINVNTKKIALLESFAKLIYRQWFILFKFPGHEKIQMKGSIPEGWEKRSLDSLTSVVTKGTTPTTHGMPFVDQGINFVKVESIGLHGNLLSNKFAYIDDRTHQFLKRSQLEVGDILFSMAGVIGRIAITPEWVLPANTNQAVAIIRPQQKIHNLFLYQTMRSHSFLSYSQGRVVQTVQANISLGALKEATIVMPDIKTLCLYNELIEPTQALVENLLVATNKLVEARDLLLSQFLNGEIEI